jgi:8-oxo-dGTP pyrophosphatase MutT (NUDIX family)
MVVSTIAAVRRVLSRNPKKSLIDASLAPAGVMLLFYPKDGEYCVLLNRRTDSVEDHKGEISFPGGRKEDGDRGLLDTALRETHEEMGVRPEDVEVLGELDDVVTRTSYLVSPFVGTIQQAYRFKPNGREVAQVIEIPFRELSSDQAYREEVRVVEGVPVRMPLYDVQGHVIFGATAQILRRFLEILESLSDEEASWKRTQP